MEKEDLNNKEIKELFRKNKFYCPICNKYFDQSDYLRTAIKNEKTRWIANMVTHYRHTHITSWNKCWGRGGGFYRRGWFGDYELEKVKVNERAKRQILRKCKEYFKLNQITVEHLTDLENNDEKTVLLTKKLLS